MPICLAIDTFEAIHRQLGHVHKVKPGTGLAAEGAAGASVRWFASECAVAAFIVVVVEPGCKGGCAVVVGGEGLAVGPLGGQGAVQALDFAVFPGGSAV